jgi:hypothetical protein
VHRPLASVVASRGHAAPQAAPVVPVHGGATLHAPRSAPLTSAPALAVTMPLAMPLAMVRGMAIGANVTAARIGGPRYAC